MRCFTFTLILLLTSINLALSQPLTEKEYSKHKLDKLIEKANRAYKELKYKKAIPLYEEAIFQKEKHTIALRTKLAYCFRMINQMNKAELIYAGIVQEKRARAITYYYYGEALMANGKYEDAEKWFLKFDKVRPDKGQGLMMAKACKEIRKLRPVFPNIDVRYMPFNSPGDDYAPMFFNDGLMFISDYDEGARHTFDWTGRAFSSLLFTQKDNNQVYSEIEELSNKFNQRDKNSGPASFAPGKQRFFFSRNSNIPNKKGNKFCMTIFMTEPSKTGGWKKPKPLPFCNSNFNFMHPTATWTGDTLYFTSDKPLGYGGTDIYMTYKNKKKKWVRPINLGEAVNSPEREAFPYVHGDGTLYFCSKGHTGYGGFDIFMTRMNREGIFERSANLGSNINSPKDDVGLVLSSDKQSGYFASNRKEGSDDDIYHFHRAIINVSLELEIVDNNTKMFLEGAKASIKAFDGIHNSLSDGFGSIHFAAKPQRVYELIVEKDGFLPFKYKINTKDIHQHKTIPIIVSMKEIPESLKPKPTEKSEEDKMLEELIDDMKDDAIEPIQPLQESYMLPPSIPARGLVILPKAEDEEEAAEQEKLSAEQQKILSLPTEASLRQPEDVEVVMMVDVLNEQKNGMSAIAVEIEALNSETNKTVRTDDVGRIVLYGKSETIYKAIIKKPGYITQAVTLNTKDKSILEIDTIYKEVVLEKVDINRTFKLANIYYSSGKHWLNRVARLELNRLAEVLKENPTFKIELGSHTDSKGTVKYNITLSQKRAKFAKDYIVSKGIDANRIVAKGYGATRLLNQCKAGIECTEKQHKRNRRTEFKIISF